jgi:hypothetical protein
MASFFQASDPENAHSQQNSSSHAFTNHLLCKNTGESQYKKRESSGHRNFDTHSASQSGVTAR